MWAAIVAALGALAGKVIDLLAIGKARPPMPEVKDEPNWEAIEAEEDRRLKEQREAREKAVGKEP